MGRGKHGIRLQRNNYKKLSPVFNVYKNKKNEILKYRI